MPSQLKMRIWKAQELPPDWDKRTQTLNEKTAESIKNDVKTIVSEVRKNGDAALLKFTEKFDKAKLKAENLRVTREESQKAYSMVTKEQVSALKLMKEKVSSFEK